MTEKNYYTGTDTFDFEYCIAPKALFKNEKFRKISDGAKLLYIAILNRLTLSAKNGLCDENQRVYVYYSIEDVCEELGCSKTKAVRIFKELDSKNGVGLIERKRLGLGKTSIIFVPKFETETKTVKTSSITSDSVYDTSESDKNDEQAVNNNIFFDLDSELSTLADSNEENSGTENDVSELLKMIRQEISETECNKNKINKNKLNKNNLNNTYNNQPISKQCTKNSETVFFNTIGWVSRMKKYREIIRKNICYEILCQKLNPSWVNEVVEVMANAISSEMSVKVKNIIYPPEAVMERYLSLTSDHIEYVADFLRRNTATVNNPHAYLLAVLYQSPETMISWYNEEAKKDGLL